MFLALVRVLLLLFLFTYFTYTQAQESIKVVMTNDTLKPADMVQHSFMGTGISVSNVLYRGDPSALGIFADSLRLTGFQKGIIISSGRVELFAGKNSRPNSGANFGHNFFFDEDFITSSDMCDGAVLEFDFIPEYDSIAFRFVFGSDEYPEFVGKNFNDAFALLVKPKFGAHTKPQNVGTLPNGSAVMINNVNHKRNSEWYVANDYFQAPLYNELEYDGLTKPIVAACKVIPNKPYHLKVIIADLEDCEYDSGVLLEALSFNSISTHKRKPFRRNYFLSFKTNESTLEDTELYKLKRLTDSLSRFAFDSIIIIGHTDSSGNDLLNQQLSVDRANTIAGYFKRAGVRTSTIRAEGMGSSLPLRPNATEQGRAINRRVEILFYRKRL
jgi:outer membrane protein OmpA-like peptidoglycan-associated protein